MAYVTKRVWMAADHPRKVASSTIPSSPASIGTERGTFKNKSFTIAANTSADTTQLAGLDALALTDLVAAIDDFITNDFGVDTASDSVSYNAEIIGIEPEDSNDIYLDDATRNLVVKTNLTVANPGS